MSISEVKSLLRERTQRLLRGIQLDTPDVILAREACGIVETLSLLWPELWKYFGDELQFTLRNRAGLCSACGETEIPVILSHPIECKACGDKLDEFFKEADLDMQLANDPKTKEMLVDCAIADSRKVDNLDEDFILALERMLERRQTAGD